MPVENKRWWARVRLRKTLTPRLDIESLRDGNRSAYHFDPMTSTLTVKIWSDGASAEEMRVDLG